MQLDGTCGCTEGQLVCNDICFTGTECPAGCAGGPGLVSNFEDLAVMVANPTQGFAGVWYSFNGGGTEHNFNIEATGGAECDAFALHTSGTGLVNYSGIGVSLGTGAVDVSTFTGLRFRAKTDNPQTTPVRVNFSTPWTTPVADGGTCTVVEGGPAAEACYNHPGRFLRDELALGADWREYTLCFDRDLYPLFLPSNSSTQQRRDVAANVLGMQFQFNNSKDLPAVPIAGTQYFNVDAGLPFDFWVDDIEFISEPCSEQLFQSTAGATNPFPQNENFGSCAPVTDAAAFNGFISQLYQHWKDTFLRPEAGGLRVNSPEQGNITVSEGIGYGMLIAAAMGDRPTFDAIYAYGRSQFGGGNNLMTWRTGDQGSATDADQDMAMGLLMADAQWPGSGYDAQADAMITDILQLDTIEQGGNLNISLGSSFDAQFFNASYFMPSYYPVFAAAAGSAASWTEIEANGFQILQNNVTAFGGLVSDWADLNNNSGAPVPQSATGAQVGSGGNRTVYGFDASRTPMRLGWDACLNGANAPLTSIMNFFATRHDGGESIDQLVSGWQGNGTPTDDATANQVAFIGPVGVGAMSGNRVAMRDRAFRAVLDILENPEFNRTYYPTSLGLIVLLTMTGNLPHP